MRKILIRTLVIVSGLSFMLGLVAYAKLPDLSSQAKPKVYDGIITQVNAGDGSFTMRLRDGSFITVSNPLTVKAFVSIKGVVDKGILGSISTLSIKDTNASDAPPIISLIGPGSGQVGTNITLTGTSFSKKNNAVSIGGVKNAVIGLASKDGQTISFNLPIAPCDQRLKINCPTNVLAPGTYDVAVLNDNGLSNSVPFSVLPLPPLTMETDVLPQVVAGSRYNTSIVASGGAESYSWRIVEGQLPPGLLLTQAACSQTPCRTNALIFGIPTTPGTYQFSVTLSSGQENVTKQFSITAVQPLSNPGYYLPQY